MKILLLGLMLTGCLTGIEKYNDQQAAYWIGHNVATVLSRQGAPNRKLESGGKEYLTYTLGELGAAGCTWTLVVVGGKVVESNWTGAVMGCRNTLPDPF